MTQTPSTPAAHADAPAVPMPKPTRIPEGLWLRCPECGALIYRKQMEANMSVCPECEFHFRIGATERVRQLTDDRTFEPMFDNLATNDPLGFRDLKPCTSRLAKEQQKTGQREGVQTGRAFIKGRPVMLAGLDLKFFMGTLSSVVGEKITRSIEQATENDLPMIIVSCSGGARMWRCDSGWRIRIVNGVNP